MLLPLLAILASPPQGVTGLRQAVLLNDLQVVLFEDHAAEIVTVCVAVRTGATCQSEETCGLAHLYEHMVFKGNAMLPDQTAYNSEMRRLGIIRNGTTSDELVKYYIVTDSRRLREGLEFMYYAVATPLLDPGEIEREREVVLDEYCRSTTSPYWDYWRVRDETLCPGEPWRVNTIGTPEVISGATREDLLRFRDLYYTPDNCALFIAGDIDPDYALSLASGIFGGWERGGRSDYDRLDVCLKISRDTTVAVASETGLASVSVVFAGPPAGSDPSSTYAADVWGAYLCMMSGEFYTDLVTNGPFTDISASYFTQRYAPAITIGGSVPAGRSREALRALRAELWQLCDSAYYDPEGIELAAEILSRSRLLDAQTAHDLAVETLPFWWALFGSLDYYETYPESVSAVGLADVTRFLNRYVSGRPSAAFVMDVPEALP